MKISMLLNAMSFLNLPNYINAFHIGGNSSEITTTQKYDLTSNNIGLHNSLYDNNSFGFPFAFVNYKIKALEPEYAKIRVARETTRKQNTNFELQNGDLESLFALVLQL